MFRNPDKVHCFSSILVHSVFFYIVSVIFLVFADLPAIEETFSFNLEHPVCGIMVSLNSTVQVTSLFTSCLWLQVIDTY